MGRAGGRWSTGRPSWGRAQRSDERAVAFVQIALERYGLFTPEIVARFESRWTWAEEAPAEPAARALWEGHQEPAAAARAARDCLDVGRVVFEHLQRMELRGEVRRGYFVTGLSGLQYALPRAVEALRESRGGLAESQDVILLSALDPVNLYGGEARSPIARGGDRRRRGISTDVAPVRPRPVDARRVVARACRRWSARTTARGWRGRGCAGRRPGPSA